MHDCTIVIANWTNLKLLSQTLCTEFYFVVWKSRIQRPKQFSLIIVIIVVARVVVVLYYSSSSATTTYIARNT